MTRFHHRTDAELAALEDEPLLAWVVACRKAGEIEAATLAAQVLVYRYERRVHGYIATRLRSRGPEACREVAEQALFDAIRSAESFKGESIRQFGSWLFTIALRRRDDYLRKGRLEQVSYEEMLEWLAEQPSDADETGSVEVKDVIDAVLASRSASHRLVLELSLFGDMASRDAAAEYNRQNEATGGDPMTAENVDKIKSRFRRDLRAALEAANRGGDDANLGEAGEDQSR